MTLKSKEILFEKRVSCEREVSCVRNEWAMREKWAAWKMSEWEESDRSERARERGDAEYFGRAMHAYRVRRTRHRFHAPRGRVSTHAQLASYPSDTTTPNRIRRLQLALIGSAGYEAVLLSEMLQKTSYFCKYCKKLHYKKKFAILSWLTLPLQLLMWSQVKQAYNGWCTTYPWLVDIDLCVCFRTSTENIY
jgi:hypothetical protein